MKMPKNALSKYFLFSIIILMGLTAAVYAQVDQDELQNLPPVAFINYEGPHTIINTREEIRQIGVVVGRELSARERNIAPTLEAMSIEERRQYSYTFQIGGLNRYFVIHSVSGPDGEKLDADIFGLGVDAGVDHIRNLRWIIQGYLQDAYGYSAGDAAVLAEFITVYNAVYRGNWDYFTSRYKAPVLEHLTRERAGLSIRYDEWPGRTLIVIPLGHGIFGPVDTSAISDRRVIEELRREDDQGVTQRQDMVELREREADQMEQWVEAEREAIRQEEQQIAEERAQVAQERQEAAEERQNIQEQLEAGLITEEEAGARLQEVDRKEQELDRRDQALDNRESALNQRREELQRVEESKERIFDEAQQERGDIARDQQAVIEREAAGRQETGILGITIERTNPSMGRLIRFNPETGAEIRRSPLNLVHVRTVSFVGGKILAVAGENARNGAVRLIEINPNTLEMEKQGDDDIKPGSLLWVNGTDLYAITAEGASCYLGRFNANLDLIAKSTVKVHSDAGVTIQQGQLLTQRENGSVLILNPADLSEIY